MESLLISLTNSSIKELERKDFQIAALRQPSLSSPSAASDSSSSDEDDEEEEDRDDFGIEDQGDRLAVLDIKDYDSMKYTGQSAGLQLTCDDLFKSKTYIPWPGREDVVLKRMAHDELMIVRTKTSGKADQRLDIGLSMQSAIFDQPRSQPSPTFGLKKPTKQLVDKMIGLHLHRFLPIVNKARFLQGAPTIVVNSVLALAFRFAAQHFPDLSKTAADHGDVYFRKVMKRLRDPVRSRLCHVQAAILMTLYLDLDDGDVESIQWFTLGSAIRMAQDLGLHRSCEHWNLPASEVETRHRVFYACYILDRWMGARAGKPLTILDRDFDTAMPSPYEVLDDSKAVQGLPIYRSFLLLIKLSEILGRVLKALYAPNAKHSNCNAGLDDPTIRVVFDRRLKHWLNSMNEPLDGVELPAVQKANLRIFYDTITLLLHRPFIQLSPKKFPDLQPIAEESRQACAEAAASILTTIRNREWPATDPDAYASLCLPTCFVYAMFQSALVHLSNAIQDPSEERMRALADTMSLIESHKHLNPAPRALEMLNMLVTVNGLHPDDRAMDRKLVLPKSSSSPPDLSYQDPLPSAEGEMPKTNWFQRMMNTSIVGGITPEIHREVESVMGQPTMQQPCFLPQPETAHLSMSYPMYHSPYYEQQQQHHPHSHPHHQQQRSIFSTTSTTTASCYGQPMDAPPPPPPLMPSSTPIHHADSQMMPLSHHHPNQHQPQDPQPQQIMPSLPPSYDPTTTTHLPWPSWDVYFHHPHDLTHSSPLHLSPPHP
ncbi:hypothetical protein EC973_001634 [Apophysomyces ossiformis]|uniref:Xylanolytic transcriptional activator regulatory domain-containing protein n=1 Tax=Apophysomyces ossiformis TaxID=679940 RepID=A0A8H7BYI8_9FUNG|nr:hypothetical protein EC973_001634 [Apophysomyces ossiformis]